MALLGPWFIFNVKITKSKTYESCSIIFLLSEAISRLKSTSFLIYVSSIVFTISWIRNKFLRREILF